MGTNAFFIITRNTPMEAKMRPPPAVTAEVEAATEKVILTPVSQTASESVILVEKRTLEPKSDEIIFQAANGPNYGLVVSNMRKGENQSPEGYYP